MIIHVCKGINAHPSQVFLSEAVVQLGTWSGCMANHKHTSFLELKQLEREEKTIKKFHFCYLINELGEVK